MAINGTSSTAGRVKPDVALMSTVETLLTRDGTSRKSTISIAGALTTGCRLETRLSQGAFWGSARSGDGLGAVEEAGGLRLTPYLWARDSSEDLGAGL